METDFAIESTAFKYGDIIPERFTGYGENSSPPLRWLHVPPETKSFVLICEDPDAPRNPPFVHWVVYNIMPDVTELRPSVPLKTFDVDFNQGKNSSGIIGYMGPKPPAGTGTHRYYFKLFALDSRLSLPEGATKEEVLEAMRDHILSEVELMGKYKYH